MKKINRRQFINTGSATIVGLTLGKGASTFNESSSFINNNETINFAESVIIVGSDADEFHLWIANELQGYLLKLYGHQFPIMNSLEVPTEKSLIILGNPRNNSLIASAQRQGLVNFTGLKPDGLILKTIKLNRIPAVVLGGNDDRGTMYAVYEFLEQLGIVFQLTNDIIPQQKSEIFIPFLDLRKEPIFKNRGMHCCHGIRWYMGLDDFRREIDQLAKMKMNVLQFYFGMGSPWIKFSYDGKVAEILYPKESGYVAWPMASGTAESVKIGRECFPEDGYLGPPEFAKIQTQEEAYYMAKQFLSKIIDYAHKRRVQVWLIIGEMPFVPPNLVPSTVKQFQSHYMGVSISHGEPAMLNIWEAAMKSLIENYPEADQYWVVIGTELTSSRPMHNIPSDDVKLQKFINDHNNLRPILEQRSSEIMDLDLADLVAADKLLRRIKERFPSAKLGAGLIFRGSLLRPLNFVLPKDISLMNMVNYRGETDMNYFDGIQGRDLAVWPRVTCDQGEMHIQLNAMMYDHHKIISEGIQYGLTGIVGQLNKSRGAEQSAQYIAEGSWNARINCKSFYKNYISRLYGIEALNSLLKAFLLLEENEKIIRKFGGTLDGRSIRLFQTWSANSKPLWLVLRSVDYKDKDKLICNRHKVEEAIHIAEESRNFWNNRVVNCNKAMKLIMEVRPLVWPGAHDELNYLIYKTKNLLAVFDLLIANNFTIVAFERALLSMITGEEFEVSKYLEQSWNLLNQANRLYKEIAKQIIPYAYIPTERHILWIFNKGIQSYDMAREYLSEVITFHKKSDR